MEVKPDEVRAYGASAAIVLGVLRQIGATASVPVIASSSRIASLAGVTRQAANATVHRLVKLRLVHAMAPRIGGPLAIRLMRCVDTVNTDRRDTATHTTRLVVGLTPRLDTLSSLLDAAG